LQGVSCFCGQASDPIQRLFRGDRHNKIMKLTNHGVHFQKQLLRTLERRGKEAVGVDLAQLEPAPAVKDWKPRAVSQKRFESESARLEEANFKLLTQMGQALLDRGDRVLPKDSSVNPSHMVMAYTPVDPLSLPFISQMAQIGTVEGFHVLARCAPEDTSDLRSQLKSWPGARNVTLVPSRGQQDVWTEDQGEFTLRGNLLIPPRLDVNTPFGVDAMVGRLERLHPEVDVTQVGPNLTSYNLEDAMARYPRANFSYQGAVGQAETHLGMLGGALALDVPEAKMTATYVEGGNFLPGTSAAGKPLAFIGRDSIAISQRVLERDLGRKPKESEVLTRIARDYGLKASEVHPVEQPADFHIDMAMTWTRPGQVILNDAMGALKLQKQWLRRQRNAEVKNSPNQKESIHSRYAEEIRRLEDLAKHQQDLENLSEKDLNSAGVEVHRLAGAFPESLANPPMNFLNLRQGTNENGETFAVMLGGTPEAEEFITGQLLQEIPTGYQRIHFLDRALTGPTLDLWGGIKCRTKPIAVA